MGLLFGALVLLAALIAVNISNKSGLPSLLLFLILGLSCNYLGVVDFKGYEISEKLASFALMIIMFYGGFDTNWKAGKPAIKEATILASLGVVVTALLTGGFIYFVFKVPIVESMLVGSIIGSTDYASVSNILASKNLNLKYNSAALLELESGSNDPTAYTLTTIFIAIAAGKDVSAFEIVVQQILLGLLLGAFIAYATYKLLMRYNSQKDGLAIVFMFAMVLLTFSLCQVLGGNGYLAVYLFGIIVGNKVFVGKRDIIFFFDGFTELMSIGMFFLLGLLATPNKVIEFLPIAFVIMLFMTFFARPVAVLSLMLPFKMKMNQLAMVSWAGLRGAAAIAFAIMAVNSSVDFKEDIYHIVFGVCLFSSLFQGSFMPIIAKKLNMVDLNDTVMKTFNFYIDKTQIGFLKTEIKEGSELIGTRVKDLNFAFDFIVSKIERDGKTVVPRGNVRFEQGDIVVIGGEDYVDLYGEDLIEFSVDKNHQWCNKKIVDIDLANNQLILTIHRNDKFVVVNGDTCLKEGDRILILTDDSVDFATFRKQNSGH